MEPYSKQKVITNASPKVIIIGLDGADWKLILPWIKNNELPAFNRIIRQGCYVILRTIIPPISIPAIPCFFTGKNPGKLGFFSFQKEDGSLVKSTDIKEKTIWDYLSENGYKSAIINLTATYPAKKLNGIMITGHIIPDVDKKKYISFKLKV